MENRFVKYLIMAFVVLAHSVSASADSIPSGFSLPLDWRVGIEASPALVPQTNSYLKGINRNDKSISRSFSGAIRADFSFSPYSRYGMLYRGAYQGVGLSARTFFANDLLGTPISAYVYQGAPIARFGSKLWLGYEWEFGAAFGWKHYNKDDPDENAAVSTSVTAHMGVSLKLHYRLARRWQMSLGVGATHFSNGNTSQPNAGVNSLGASIGLAYMLNEPDDVHTVDGGLEAVADRPEWFYDIIAYGAWRKRIVSIYDSPTLCPGRFGVAGLQFAPMRKFNRWLSAGVSLDMQYDESAGLDKYWVDGSSGDNVKFYRPPFSKQISVGLSAHAEFTMPIFAINAGLGYDMLNPEGEKRLYQMLTLKTFVSDRLFLNVGYRLGDFKEPQNLMLGIGVRL